MNYKTLLSLALISTSISAFADKGDHGGNTGNGMATIYTMETRSTGLNNYVKSPVQTFYNAGESVDLNFTTDLGIVKVVIKNSFGKSFYYKEVDTSVESSVYFNIKNLPKGIFTISILNANNNIFDSVRFEKK